MTKFLFFTDTHLKGVNPISRRDNYADSILTKIDEVVDIGIKHDVDFYVFGGDWYDTHRIYNYFVIQRAIDILKRTNKLYYIIGQHDLSGYNPETFDNSACAFTFAQLEDKAIHVNEPIELDDCILSACNVYNDIENYIGRKPVIDKPTILMAHKLLSTTECIFDTVSCDKLAGCFDLVLSGDLHSGIELCEIKGTQFFNPGALSRKTISKNDVGRKIQVGLIEIDNKNIKVTPIRLENVKPAEDVFIENRVVPEKVELNVDNFVEELNNITQGIVNIYDLISKLGEQKGIDKSVLDYILSKRPPEK